MIEVPVEFSSFLRTEEANATDETLNDQRAAALRAYKGEPYGDEIDGRSQAVTRDVSEVVDFMGVGVLGTIMAGGKAVEFETEVEKIPVAGPDGKPQIGQDGQPVTEDKDYGAEATAAVQYQFFRKQKGYRILHDALKSGMLEKTGIVKTTVEKRRPLTETQDMPAGMIEAGTFRGMKVVQADAIDEGWQPGMQSLMMRVTYEVPQPAIVRDEQIPNEYFLVAPDVVDLDEAVYVGQRTAKTISQLVELGYDRDELMTMSDSVPADTTLERARDGDRGRDRNSIGRREGSERTLWLNEEYALYDLDGDGIAERHFVHRIGMNILNVMPVDEQPYSIWSPFPMQSRLVGQSTADKTMDIQRIRSVLLRQGLDSLYLGNVPRTMINVESMTEDTIDDLLTVRPGALIRYKGITPPAPLQSLDTSPQAFAAMEMMSAERESRTGVTRQSQGMNPDTTNKTATGMAMLQGNSDQIQLYVTRNFAEMLVASMFAKRYRLMRAHVGPFRMKIEGAYQTVDPSKWPEEPDIQINVGIGTGTKDQRITLRTGLLDIQERAMMGGLSIVGEQEVYNNLKGLIEDAGIGIATDYVKDPSTLPPQPPQEDPEAIKAKSEAEMAAQKLQGEQAIAAARLQGEQSMQGAKIQGEQQMAAVKLQTQRDEASAKVQLLNEEAAAQQNLAEARAAAEMQLAIRQQDNEFQLELRRLANDETLAERRHELAEKTALSKNRPGGDLGK